MSSRMRRASCTAVAATKVAATTRPAAAPGAAAAAARAAADSRVLDVCRPVLFGPDSSAAFAPGVLSAEAGHAAYDAIVRAVGAAMKREVDAIATAPVNKEAFQLAGLPWAGHTDLL